MNQLNKLGLLFLIAKLRKVDFKKNQKLMIESVNDLSLSLCVYMLIRHTGMERKSIELKSERELQVPENFVVFCLFFFKVNFGFFLNI